mgnify:CR=1 FL=1
MLSMGFSLNNYPTPQEANLGHGFPNHFTNLVLRIWWIQRSPKESLEYEIGKCDGTFAICMCQVEGAESKEDKRTMDVIDSGHEGLLDLGQGALQNFTAEP